MTDKNEAKHTRGPWVMIPSMPQEVWNGWMINGQPPALRGFTQTIADVHGPQDSAEAEANARLIATAPDMLAALEKLASYNKDIIAGRINYRPEDHIAVARAAIARAEGATE